MLFGNGGSLEFLIGLSLHAYLSNSLLMFGGIQACYGMGVYLGLGDFRDGSGKLCIGLAHCQC